MGNLLGDKPPTFDLKDGIYGSRKLSFPKSLIGNPWERRSVLRWRQVPAPAVNSQARSYDS